MARHLHIIDSGAVAIFNRHNSAFNQFAIITRDKKTKKSQKTGGRQIDYSFYDSEEFDKYLESYVDFLKEYKDHIDHYVTLDALRNPKRSWEITRRLKEDYGLDPIPVIHFNTPVKWLAKYLDAGYKYIGLGGRTGRLPYWTWADSMFNEICNQSSRLPLVKTHGFAITTHKHATRYPWYSVDSTTSKKMAYYGQILVPIKRGGEFDWTIPNRTVFIDSISPYSNRGKEDGHPDQGNAKGRHFQHLARWEQAEIKEWMESQNIPFGDRDDRGRITELGVSTCKQERVAANIKYFLWLQSKIPEYPWAFHPPDHHPTLFDVLKGQQK